MSGVIEIKPRHPVTGADVRQARFIRCVAPDEMRYLANHWNIYDPTPPQWAGSGYFTIIIWR